MEIPTKSVKEVLEDFIRICDTARPMEFLKQLSEIPEVARKALVASNQADVLDWAVRRWNEEVKNRPLINIHRRTLDDTWRQIIRKAGGDDRKLVGPTHDELVAEALKPTPQPNEHQNAWLDVLKEERKLTDDLVAALRKLLRRDERNTCQHEETYNVGAAWTYCSTCNMKWSDSKGDTPKFDEPIEWVESRTALDNVRKHRNEATEGSGS